MCLGCPLGIGSPGMHVNGGGNNHGATLQLQPDTQTSKFLCDSSNNNQMILRWTEKLNPTPKTTYTHNKMLEQRCCTTITNMRLNIPLWNQALNRVWRRKRPSELRYSGGQKQAVTAGVYAASSSALWGSSERTKAKLKILCRNKFPSALVNLTLYIYNKSNSVCLQFSNLSSKFVSQTKKADS